MGQSTDAILCYGICVASETVEQLEEPDEDGYDEAMAVAKKRNPLGYAAFLGDSFDIDGIKVKLEQHQSASYPEYLLTVEESITTAWRGTPRKITSLEVKPGWAEAIRAAAKKYKVKAEGGDAEPKWWLASDWS